MPLRIMSFNIQHCADFYSGNIDFDLFADAVKKSGADIIGLNEVRDKGSSEDFEAQAFVLAAKCGLYSCFAKAIQIENKGPYGNALLSRYPILSYSAIGIPDPETKQFDGYYETRCLLKAKIDYGNGLDVLVTHFGLNVDEQINAAATVLNKISDNNCVLMGDFNLQPDSRIIKSISSRINDTSSASDEPLFTFPSDKPCKKIDYIFVSRDICVKSVFVPEMIVSDHRPIMADVELQI